MDNYWKGCPPKMNDARFLTDYRSSTRRELYIKYLNGIERDDDQRAFYQKNGENIMNNEWEILKRTQSCSPNACIHKSPTRTNPMSNYQELLLYNAVRTGKLKLPPCQKLKDYRMNPV